MVKYVVGHKNPDTDSVCSAIALANLKKELGEDVKAVIQGELNPETRFVLDRFEVETPEIMTDASGKELILVDHTEVAQSLDNLSEGKIIQIVDHHKLGDVTTKEPIEVFVMPVGSTCTIIKSLYDSHGIDIPKDIAGLMLSAILSDTIIFKSPTASEEDKMVAQDLANICGVDNLEEFGQKIMI